MTFQKGNKLNLLSSGFKGKQVSEENRLKTSQRLKGNKYRLGFKHTKETLEKFKTRKNGWEGKKHSEETKRKMKGRVAWCRGKKFSEEHKRKISEAHRGSKSYNWLGGKTPYPFEFNKKLKLKIRERDNFICCLCGRTEREELEELNRVLSVNHIDFNKQNCKENNLNTLCLRCNVKINREREYWTEYFQNKLLFEGMIWLRS